MGRGRTRNSVAEVEFENPVQQGALNEDPSRMSLDSSPSRMSFDSSPKEPSLGTAKQDNSFVAGGLRRTPKEVSRDSTFERPDDGPAATSDVDTSTIFTKMQKAADKDSASMGSRALDTAPICRTIWDFAVSPYSPQRLGWDSIVLVLVIYSAFWQPYSAAFAPQLYIYKWDIAVDLMFCFDIILNFNTGYDKGFEVIMDKNMIIYNYLRGWFAIDLVATLPWDVMFEGVRGAKILRVLRVARAGRLISNVFMSRTIKSGYLEAIKFFLYVSVVAHLLACFFFMWPMLISCEKDHLTANTAFLHPDQSTWGWHQMADGADTCMQNSWRQGPDDSLEALCIEDASGRLVPLKDDYHLRVCQETREFGYRPGHTEEWFIRENMEYLYKKHPYNTSFVAAECKPCLVPSRLYIDALYWSLTTMTTIGYGDRGPNTEAELVFVMFAEVFGLAFFALLLNQVTQLYEVVNVNAAARNQRKDALVAFLTVNQASFPAAPFFAPGLRTTACFVSQLHV